MPKRILSNKLSDIIITTTSQFSALSFFSWLEKSAIPFHGCIGHEWDSLRSEERGRAIEIFTIPAPHQGAVCVVRLSVCLGRYAKQFPGLEGGRKEDFTESGMSQ